MPLAQSLLSRNGKILIELDLKKTMFLYLIVNMLYSRSLLELLSRMIGDVYFDDMETNVGAANVLCGIIVLCYEFSSMFPLS